MSVELKNHKGLQVPETTTGDGGEAIKENFEHLAEWGPRSVWDADRDPTASDDDRPDDGQGNELNFGVGSQWLNTSTNKLFICRDSTTAAAKWQLVPFLLSNAAPGVNQPVISGTLNLNGNDIGNAGIVYTNGIDVSQTIAGISGAGEFWGSGASIINLNASNLSSGTVPNARLSSNVARRDQYNPWSSVQTFFSFVEFMAPVYVDGSVYAAGDVTAEATMTARAFKPTMLTLTDGASISWNLNLGQAAVVTLGGNRTLSNPTNHHAGTRYSLIVKQDTTGGRTLAYGSAYRFPGGVAPALSTAADAMDVLEFLSDGTDMLLVNFAGALE